jgi:hypothetical protein
MKYLLTLLILVTFYPSHAQRAWYVDPRAGSGGHGTKERPLNDIGALNSLEFMGGDSVIFAPGLTIRGTFRPVLKNAGPGAPLWIGTRAGCEPAVIEGDSLEAVILSGLQQVILQNLVLKGRGRKTGNHTAGLFLDHCSQVRVRDIGISGFQKAGLEVFDCSGVTVERVMACDNGFAGIELSGSRKSACHDILISNCSAHDNPGDPTNLENHSGNGIVAGMCSRVSIQRCEAYNNGWDMPRIGNGPVGIWAWEADSVVISDCISHDNKTHPGAMDGGGFDLDGGVTRSRICYCLSYRNQGSGFGIFQYAGASPWRDNELFGNISIDDGRVTAGAASVLVWSSDGEAAHLQGLSFHDNVLVNRVSPVLGYHADSRHRFFSWKGNHWYGRSPAWYGDPRDDRFDKDLFCALDAPSPADGVSPMPGVRTFGKECRPPFDVEWLLRLKGPDEWVTWSRSWLGKSRREWPY